VSATATTPQRTAALKYVTDGLLPGVPAAPIPLCRPVVGQARGCLDHGPDCDKPGKRALVRWKGYQEKPPTRAEVEAWWRQWPEANLGLVTGGAAGVVVWDEDGAEAQHGPLPATLIARSGRPGGRHRYFQHPGGRIPSQAGVYPDIDVRADGGLVVLPPSLHYSGNHYHWEPSSLEHGLAPLPDWLLDQLRAPAPEVTGHTRLDVAAILAGVPEGQRDDQLFRLACRLRAADIPQEWADRLVVEAATNCRPPFNETDALAKVASAYGRYSPTLPPEVSSLSSLLSLSESDETSRPWLVTLGQLTQRYGCAVAWLVQGYVQRGALTVVPGPPESFKSWAMVDLCRAVHTGGQWLGQFDVPQGGALYVEQERGRNLAYQGRLLAQGHGCNLDDLAVVPPAGLDLHAPLWQTRLSETVRTQRPMVVVINSFRSVYRGQAGDGPAIARALGWLGVLAEETGAAIILLDQVNKAGGTGKVRGMAAHADSLQKEYEADAVLHVERDRDAVGHGVGPARVYVGKLREGDAGTPFTFSVVPVDGGGVQLRYDGETEVERAETPPTARAKVVHALGAASAPARPAALAHATGLSVGTVSNTLTDLKATGEARQVGYGQWELSSLSLRVRESETDDTAAPTGGAIAQRPVANGQLIAFPGSETAEATGHEEG
jgi:hypothetical protein